MKQLKKYFKLPPKNVCIIYGVAIAVILIAFLSVYFTFGKQLTAFVSEILMRGLHSIKVSVR